MMKRHRFSADDICYMHKTWLGDIYEWAGSYRQVNISKSDFTFAMAVQVPKLMEKFESDLLNRYTPCKFISRVEVVCAIAEVHVEQVLIHPFREGNGRCARLLSSLMALQAGLPLLNYKLMSGENKKRYFTAIQAGLDMNYQPMKHLFEEIIESSIVFSQK